MARYVTTESMALIAADSVLSVIATTAVRPRINHIVISSSSAPNDYSAHFHFQRFSADGTADNAITPKPLDFADAASVTTSNGTYTAEPTVTADEIMLNVAHNQRGTWQFVPVPGNEIIIPALAGDGIAMVCKAVSTQFTEEVTIYFQE